MMTKWDTIQADVADQYIYLDEQAEYEMRKAEMLDSFDDDDLTLEWEA